MLGLLLLSLLLEDADGDSRRVRVQEEVQTLVKNLARDPSIGRLLSGIVAFHDFSRRQVRQDDAVVRLVRLLAAWAETLHKLLFQLVVFQLEFESV